MSDDTHVKKPTYRCTYEYSKPFGSPKHNWSVIGARGAVQLHITVVDKYGPSGGIEIHYLQPPEYMKNDAPSHDICWLLKCPCWHDGSSLQAEEVWIPRWQDDPHNHDAMFIALQRVLEENTDPTP